MGNAFFFPHVIIVLIFISFIFCKGEFEATLSPAGGAIVTQQIKLSDDRVPSC